MTGFCWRGASSHLIVSAPTEAEALVKLAELAPGDASARQMHPDTANVHRLIGAVYPRLPRFVERRVGQRRVA